MKYVILLLLLALPVQAGAYSLLTEINRQRIKLGVPGSLRVNHDLQQAAAVLGQNHQHFGCFEAHESCQGETLKRRFDRFYPGYFGGGEIWALGFGVQDMVDAWLDSPSHRATMLGGYLEFGESNIPRPTAYGYFNEGIVDFGFRYMYPVGTPVISGAIYDGYAWLTYQGTTKPQSAYVDVGTHRLTLALYEGTPTYGVFRAAVPEPQGCTEVRFTLRNSDATMTFPNPKWPLMIGPLCPEPATLLTKVRINLNKNGKLKFNLETLPGQNPQVVRIVYGSNRVIEGSLVGIVKQSTLATRIVGSYTDLPIVPEGGVVSIYLDDVLVAVMFPKKVTPDFMLVQR